MPDEHGLIRLAVDDIKPGDEIYIATPVKFGNTPFRYPMYKKETVVRVTPKKTKVNTDQNEWPVNTTRFYADSQELQRRNLVTTHMLASLNKISELSYYRYSARDMSDEDLIAYATHICEANAMLRNTRKD